MGVGNKSGQVMPDDLTWLVGAVKGVACKCMGVAAIGAITRIPTCTSALHTEWKRQLVERNCQWKVRSTVRRNEAEGYACLDGGLGATPTEASVGHEIGSAASIVM